MPVPPTNEGRTFKPEPLTPAEVRALLSAASTRSSSGIRIRALIGVLYGSGLRLAEALALKPHDYDPKASTIRIMRGKGDKARTVGIDPHGAALLDSWLERRRTLGLNGRHLIFSTYETGSRGIPIGSPMDPRYVRASLAKLGEKADIGKRVHPHGLRHSAAFAMAENGTPTHQIQQMLGHSNLAVTSRYVAHLNPVETIAAMKAREW